MEISKTIAGLMGPTLVALAAALFANIDSISALVEPVSHDPASVGLGSAVVCGGARHRARAQSLGRRLGDSGHDLRLASAGRWAHSNAVSSLA